MRTSSIQSTVVQAIRQRIISGIWPAGSRLATREELALLFSTSPSNVQAVIRRLVAEGSVVTRKRAGAFVADEPPECCRFALVMSAPGPRNSGGRSFFLDQLKQSAERVAALHPGWNMELWTAGDKRLNALIASGALAGILYFGVPEKMPDVAAASSGIPLALFSLPGQTPQGALSISIDNQNLFKISLRSHLARGRTRIGVLETGVLLTATTRQLAKPAQQLVKTMSRAGATCRPSWIQFVNPLNPLAVYQTTLLVMGGPATERPEALILMDDHLLPPVLAAIRSLGLRVPTDVTISVLAFAGPKQRPDGCIRIGYDVQELVLEVLRRLLLRRQGKAAPSRLCMALAERNC